MNVPHMAKFNLSGHPQPNAGKSFKQTAVYSVFKSTCEQFSSYQKGPGGSAWCSIFSNMRQKGKWQCVEDIDKQFEN
ncbi:hypothetical protein DPMN_003790 [Dreissena polymorpha]|uniref:Uncharacterized protein n=1 Tax=Dreissena polymorpha TaxID=45954 RepID=A0A9D4DT27_DREPO|nr:hypothetical protein DPMN_190050 [Dreissena polymorpha]KAH3879880.1 hypothetical protein DPMN_003790 [Dreissena polymorpha]